MVPEVTERIYFAPFTDQFIFLQECFIDDALSHWHVNVHRSMHCLLALHLYELVTLDSSLSTIIAGSILILLLFSAHTRVVHEDELGDVSTVCQNTSTQYLGTFVAIMVWVRFIWLPGHLHLNITGQIPIDSLEYRMTLNLLKRGSKSRISHKNSSEKPSN